MRIESVTLEKVKSYAGPTTIDFGEGVHAILGENGAGKSTIQEAIGFCLFGTTPPHTNQSEMVRDGESSGSVTVVLTLDGVEYELTRRLGRTNPKIVNRTADIEVEVDNVTEYDQWLESKFGLPDSLDLADLWSNCIGVAQTDFISDFTDTETNRVDTFDELLGIDAYREAYDKLVDLPKAFESNISDLRREISHLDAEVESLPETRQEADQLRTEIEQLESRLRNKRNKKRRVQQDLDRLDAYEAAESYASARVAELNADIVSKRSEVANAIDDREAAYQAETVVARTETAYEAYEEAQEELERLRNQKNTKQRLERKVSSLREELTEANAEVEKAQDRVDEVKEAQRTVARLSHIPTLNEAIQNDIADLSHDESLLSQVTNTIEETPTEIKDAETKAERLQDEIDEKESRRDLAETVGPLTEKKAELKAEIRQRERDVEEVETRIGTLEEAKERREDDEVEAGTTESPPCPTCGQPLDEDLDTHIQQRERELAELQDEISSLNDTLDKVKNDFNEARAAQEALQKLPELERERDNARQRAAELENTLQEAQKKKSRLEREQNWAGRLRTHREQAIKPKLNAFQAAQGTLEQTDDPDNPLAAAKQALEAAETARTETADEISQLNEELEDYEGIEDEIEAAEEKRDEHEAGHSEYEDHIDDAETIEEREAAVREAITDLHGVAREHYRTEQYRQAASARFDADEQSTLKSQKSTLETKVGDLSARLEQGETRLEGLKEEIGALEEKHTTRQQKGEELRRLKRDLAFATFTRETLKNAGPKMRELVATKVSERANEIYQSLRGTGTERLEWDKTYLVIVHDQSHSKAFGQLSGGEKMAAALSIRLALLERLATVDMAFLDEPTKNLDADKKRNLVDHLEAIDTMDQLTVISHDSTFEAMTEFAIKLEKGQETEIVAD